MEGKRAHDDSGPCRDSDVSNGICPRSYSPRLPTPDASRSSDATSSISSSSYSDVRRGPAVSDLLSFRPHIIDTKPYPDVRVFDTRSDNKERTVPRSPPYPANDDRKLSQTTLPPLRMVGVVGHFITRANNKKIIAHAMNSPPETPRTGGTSLQPSPREPSLSSATFKPLAFYPNKKPRTEERSEQPQWQSINDTARAAPASYIASASYSSTSRRLSDPSNKRQRRYSHHSTCNNTRCYENSDRNAYFTFTSRPTSSGLSTVSAPQFEHNGERTSFERFPISPSSEISYGRQEVLPHRTAISTEVPQAAPRSYNLLPAPSPEYEQNSYRRHALEPYRRTSYEQAHVDQRRDYDEHPSCRDSCHSSDARAFFMPPHYDYTQGKSRKRSNLPKQSTEIMKTWFDKVFCSHVSSQARS